MHVILLVVELLILRVYKVEILASHEHLLLLLKSQVVQVLLLIHWRYHVVLGVLKLRRIIAKLLLRWL